MAAPDSYSAWLNRDSQESQRLNSQHKLLTRALGYTLHPQVQAGLPPDARIADIGTGTGIVLAELAKTLPSTCQLDGFDVSDAQYPDRAALPPNLHLYVADAKQPFPDDFRAKYDLVYVRYLNLALSPPEWKLVASNLHSLVKPGGHIHWIEPNLLQSATLLRRDATRPVPAFQVLAQRFIPRIQHLEYAAKELAQVLEAVGFVDVIHEVSGTDRVSDDRDAWTLNTLDAVASAWSKMEASKASDDNDASFNVDATIAQLYDEGRDALYSRYDLHLFVGTKV